QLRRGLGILRLLHQLDDLRPRGVGADLGPALAKAPALVDGRDDAAESFLGLLRVAQLREADQDKDIQHEDSESQGVAKAQESGDICSGRIVPIDAGAVPADIQLVVLLGLILSFNLFKSFINERVKLILVFAEVA
ncbi:MAG: hypothetical protein AABY09_04470, partial [Nanoarchaeota archaeon]